VTKLKPAKLTALERLERDIIDYVRRSAALVAAWDPRAKHWRWVEFEAIGALCASIHRRTEHHLCRLPKRARDAERGRLWAMQTAGAERAHRDRTLAAWIGMIDRRDREHDPVAYERRAIQIASDLAKLTRASS